MKVFYGYDSRLWSFEKSFSTICYLNRRHVASCFDIATNRCFCFSTNMYSSGNFNLNSNIAGYRSTLWEIIIG